MVTIECKREAGSQPLSGHFLTSWRVASFFRTACTRPLKLKPVPNSTEMRGSLFCLCNCVPGSRPARWGGTETFPQRTR